MKTLFISDLHLEPEQTDVLNCFNEFITSCLGNVSKIKALYILGDLFEVWIGDDASIPFYQQPIKQLKKLSDAGIRLYVMHGNRDFLMGSEFELATGCTIIPDLYHLTFFSEKSATSKKRQTVLLSHGDVFCTDDLEYMQFRKMVRNPAWQKEFLSKTISERFGIAQMMRKQSKLRGQEKKSEIMDVNQNKVMDVMLENGVNLLIHGHTHRPDTHELLLNGQPSKRIVLPDWAPEAQAFVIHDSGIATK